MLRPRIVHGATDQSSDTMYAILTKVWNKSQKIQGLEMMVIF